MFKSSKNYPQEFEIVFHRSEITKFSGEVCENQQKRTHSHSKGHEDKTEESSYKV